jgi:2-methylcitrate dehydratase PrpD
MRETNIMSASMDSRPIGESLGQFIAASTWDTVPVAVRNKRKWSLLNFIGCALGVAHAPAIEMALRVLLRCPVRTGSR